MITEARDPYIKEYRLDIPIKMEKMASRGGFAKTMWCGDEACEVRMKEEAGVTSRCIPFEQEKLGEVCACCGRPAKHMVVWGVAY